MQGSKRSRTEFRLRLTFGRHYRRGTRGAVREREIPRYTTPQYGKIQVMDERDAPICRRCNRPVGTSAAHYETFERMHYVCFHYEFEHDPTDVDSPCAAGGCPSEVAGGREALTNALDSLIAELSNGSPASWDNQSLPDYLGALRAWLADSDGYYLNRKRVPPTGVTTLLADALQAARFYE